MNVNAPDARTFELYQVYRYIHFFTKAGLGNNINTPADIEGIWHFVYFSYSNYEQKSVGISMNDNSD